MTFTTVVWAHRVPARPASEDPSPRPSGAGRPVTAGWGGLGPGNGNDHPDGGVYLLLTGNVVRDVPVPDRHHRLGMLQLARALGDARAGGRPVVRPHLRNRWAGLARLLDSARGDSGMGGE